MLNVASILPWVFGGKFWHSFAAKLGIPCILDTGNELMNKFRPLWVPPKWICRAVGLVEVAS